MELQSGWPNKSGTDSCGEGSSSEVRRATLMSLVKGFDSPVVGGDELFEVFVEVKGVVQCYT